MVASPSALTSKLKLRLINIIFINIKLINIIIQIIASYLEHFMS